MRFLPSHITREVLLSLGTQDDPKTDNTPPLSELLGGVELSRRGYTVEAGSGRALGDLFAETLAKVVDLSTTITKVPGLHSRGSDVKHCLWNMDGEKNLVLVIGSEARHAVFDERSGAITRLQEAGIAFEVSEKYDKWNEEKKVFELGSIVITVNPEKTPALPRRLFDARVKQETEGLAGHELQEATKRAKEEVARELFGCIPRQSELARV